MESIKSAVYAFVVWGCLLVTIFILTACPTVMWFFKFLDKSPVGAAVGRKREGHGIFNE